MQRSPLYIVLFATGVCLVCAVVVSSAAVSLKERQDANVLLERQRNVLQAAGLLEPGEEVGRQELARRFAKVEPVAVELASGRELPDVDAASYDQRKAAVDPATIRPAPANAAQVRRLPEVAVVYQVRSPDGALEMLVLPIEGKGLWSTLYGFLALDADLTTVRGITFYQHGETPGLGGEVDNPKWKARWIGRKAFGEGGQPDLSVIKGRAGSSEEDPHHVDGLSGATLTSNGVTHLVQFWLGHEGFGPYLDALAAEKES